MNRPGPTRSPRHAPPPSARERLLAALTEALLGPRQHPPPALVSRLEGRLTRPSADRPAPRHEA